MTSIKCPNPFSIDIHRYSRQQNSNPHTSTSNKHNPCPSRRNPIIKEIRKSKEHEILECNSSNKRLHRVLTISIQHVREASVHIDQQCTNSKSIENRRDNVTLSSIDTQAEAVKTDTSEN